MDDDGDFDMYDFEVATAVPALETDPEHAEHGFPRIASSRNNLTALSQRYNVRRDPAQAGIAELMLTVELGT